MAEQAQTSRSNAARERALIDFARRHDDRVGLRHQPRLVNFPEIGNDRDDRDVLHVRIVARAQRGVVEQRMNRDDHVRPVVEEEIAQALAIERLAEADERAIAAASVGRIVERTVDRRSVAQRHAVAQPELRQREGAVCGDVVDAGLERFGVCSRRGPPSIALAALRWPPPVSEIREAPVWSLTRPVRPWPLPSSLARPAGIASAPAGRASLAISARAGAS